MTGARTQRVLLRSAIRTATTATSSQLQAVQGNSVAIGPYIEYDAQSARFYLNVSAVSGTGGLTLQIRAYDRASGNSIVLTSNATAITAAGLYCFDVGSLVGGATGNRLVAFQGYLPVQYDVNIVHADGSSYTYSLSMETTG